MRDPVAAILLALALAGCISEPGEAPEVDPDPTGQGDEASNVPGPIAACAPRDPPPKPFKIEERVPLDGGSKAWAWEVTNRSFSEFSVVVEVRPTEGHPATAYDGATATLTRGSDLRVVGGPLMGMSEDAAPLLTFDGASLLDVRGDWRLEVGGGTSSGSDYVVAIVLDYAGAPVRDRCPAPDPAGVSFEHADGDYDPSAPVTWSVTNRSTTTFTVLVEAVADGAAAVVHYEAELTSSQGYHLRVADRCYPCSSGTAMVDVELGEPYDVRGDWTLSVPRSTRIFSHYAVEVVVGYEE